MHTLIQPVLTSNHDPLQPYPSPSRPVHGRRPYIGISDNDRTVHLARVSCDINHLSCTFSLLASVLLPLLPYQALTVNKDILLITPHMKG